MGWLNILWVVLVLFLILGARAKKIGVVSVGKNEWGILEILGFPTIPIPFGLWPYMKGVFHVKKASTAPIRVVLQSRRELKNRVIMYSITVLLRVGRSRKELIAAIYGALDENEDDAENPERILQSHDIVEAGVRKLLLNAETIDVVTRKALRKKCGADLLNRLGEHIDAVYIREDAPVDGQLWKEGRVVVTNDATENEAADEGPTFTVVS
jgi:hypothetical protein